MLICQLTDLHVRPVGRAANRVSDTNMFTERAFRAVSRLNPRPDVVVITGDFLTHHFVDKVRVSGKNESTATVALRTMRRVEQAFARAFPKAQFLITLGNNDDPCGDYRTAPTTIIEAVADGRSAAQQIARFLDENAVSVNVPEYHEVVTLRRSSTPDNVGLISLEGELARVYHNMSVDYDRIPRQEMPKLAKSDRRGLFLEINQGYTEAQAVADHYHGLLDKVAARGLDAEISVKPTQLGLDLSEELCRAHVQRVLSTADAVDRLVLIDMESSEYVERTLTLCRSSRQRSERIRICLLAALKRTPSADDSRVVTQFVNDGTWDDAFGTVGDVHTVRRFSQRFKCANDDVLDRAWRHGRADDHGVGTVRLRQRRPDLPDDPADLVQVSAAVSGRRGANAHQGQIGGPQAVPHRLGRPQGARGHCGGNERFQAGFDDWRPALVERQHLARVGVDADDVMAAAGQTGGGHGSHIAKSEQCDVHRIPISHRQRTVRERVARC